MNYLRLAIITGAICALAITAALLAHFLTASKTTQAPPIHGFNITTVRPVTENNTTVKPAIKNDTTSKPVIENDTTGKPAVANSTITNSTTLQASTASQSSYWMIDATLITGRWYFGSALLTNGQLIIGGGLINSDTVTSACEIYLPSISWLSLPPMKAYRYYFTLTSFPNDTKALAAGTAYSTMRQTAEVFDTYQIIEQFFESTSNTWTFTSTNMSTGHYFHTATLLGNGQILIAGGYTSSSLVTAVAELYNPSTNSFMTTQNMNTARYLHTSTLLSDGSTVLVTGGIDISDYVISSGELYINGSWIFTNNGMINYRSGHAAVLLNDGTVLIAGGGDGHAYSYGSAEIYISTTGTFTAVQSMKYRRESLTLTLLPSGEVLATGGIDWNTNTYPAVCELYNPMTRSWSNTLMLNYGRAYHQTVLLSDSVLTIGGYNGSGNTGLSSCEKYNLYTT